MFFCLVLLQLIILNNFTPFVFVCLMPAINSACLVKSAEIVFELLIIQVTK